MIADAHTDDALPLLAFTLREMYERCRQEGRLTLKVYHDDLRGIQGAVARVVERIKTDSAWTQEVQSGLRQAFLKLVRVNDEGRFTRQSCPWADLPKAAAPVLEAFVNARLLRSSGEQVEVTHESLFRVWPELAAWLKEGQELMLWKKHIEDDLKDWNTHDRSPDRLLAGAAWPRPVAGFRATPRISPRRKGSLSKSASPPRMINSRKGSPAGEVSPVGTLGGSRLGRGFRARIIASGSAAMPGSNASKRSRQSIWLTNKPKSQKTKPSWPRLRQSWQGRTPRRPRRTPRRPRPKRFSPVRGSPATGDGTRGTLDRSLLLAVAAIQIEDTSESRQPLRRAPGSTVAHDALAHQRGACSRRGVQPRRQDHRNRVGAGGGKGSGVALCVTATGRRLRSHRSPCEEGSVSGVTFSPDGTYVAAGCTFGRGGGIALLAREQASSSGKNRLRRQRVRSQASPLA